MWFTLRDGGVGTKVVIDGTKVIAISMKKIPFLAIVVGVPSSIIAEGLVYVSTSKCPHILCNIAFISAMESTLVILAIMASTDALPSP